MSIRSELNPVANTVLIFQKRGAVEQLIDELSPEDAREFGAGTLEAGKQLIAKKPNLQALAEAGERR